MSNINCLEGLRCPKCGYDGQLLIGVDCIAKVNSDGIVKYTGEGSWDEGNYCECNRCHYKGIVADFYAEEQEDVGRKG